eukprot:CAMPEP_0182453740 /NCGR_PEP_ID=MMETSP1319-20130603/675_1 /TAXON_ID=172717 /ORGANISM="Bolidomonas pacifica, Strain RCC208" /LENGTH=206 /DNA_ID=CAMNT_0024651695 /DNA_START=171 /DNA_END=791 /DNA_ORIENTATION=-
MKTTVALLLAFLVNHTFGADYCPTSGKGGAYFTTHATHTELDCEEHYWDESDEIKEYHFHVYFWPKNPVSVADALRLRDNLVSSVSRGDFVAVCEGVNSTVLPGLAEDARVPSIDYEPMGPHPVGNYEIWVPQEYLGKVTSFMMLNRGENTLLFHPKSYHCVEDHTGRVMWMGVPFNLDRSALNFEGPECNVPQYTELGLGYSAPE